MGVALPQERLAACLNTVACLAILHNDTADCWVGVCFANSPLSQFKGLPDVLAVFLSDWQTYAAQSSDGDELESCWQDYQSDVGVQSR